ncbi:MAG: POTRA domain-containing protein [Planctomycetota bacterium]
MIDRAIANLVAIFFLCSGLVWGGQNSKKEDERDKFQVEADFSGNATLKSTDLRAVLRGLLAEMRELGVDDSGMEDGSYLLERYYKQQGFPEIAVVPGQVRKSGNKFSIRFIVREKKRTILHGIDIIGARRIRKEQISECFPWIAEGFVGDLLGLGRSVFTRDVLEDGVECVRTLYRFRGFFDCQVTWQTRQVPHEDQKERLIRVEIRIEEGEQKTFRRSDVEIYGHEKISAGQILEELEIDDVAPFEPRGRDPGEIPRERRFMQSHKEIVHGALGSKFTKITEFCRPNGRTVS